MIGTCCERIILFGVIQLILHKPPYLRGDFQGAGNSPHFPGLLYTNSLTEIPNRYGSLGFVSTSIRHTKATKPLPQKMKGSAKIFGETPFPTSPQNASFVKKRSLLRSNSRSEASESSAPGVLSLNVSRNDGACSQVFCWHLKDLRGSGLRGIFRSLIEPSNLQNILRKIRSFM